MRFMRVPSPGRLSASMRPPWASAMVWAMERPRPLPGFSQVGIEVRAVLRGEGRGPAREAFDQDVRLHGLHAEGRRRRLRAREEQQIFDHPRHRRRLLDYLPQKLLVLAVAVELEPDLRVAP